MTAPAASADNGRHYRVAILGAGLSGLCMAMQLKRHGVGDFVMLEKADSVGGTWRENTYPGVACDVPSHVYSFSFALNPDWSQAFSGGDEIRAYCERCVEDFGLGPHLRFGQKVTDLEFTDGVWHIATEQQTTLTADLVVSGLGGLHVPNQLEWSGSDQFRGPRFHTARWDHGVDLRGRRVALIGTGASAVQVLPRVAPDAEQVTVFQRSPAWVFPRMVNRIDDRRRQQFRDQPWRMRLHRWALWTLMDAAGTLSLRRGSRLNRRLREQALDFLEQEVQDPELRRKLTPDYEAGCKRRCISDDYLAAFNRANVELVTDSIERFEADGIRDAAGRLHPADVIIEATGFRPFDITRYVNIRGRDGHSLQELWQDRIESYRTLMVPGFPNFFMLLGPNSATGHTSALIMIEEQARFVLRCLRLLRQRRARHVEPVAEATDRFNRKLQRDMQKMVFSGGCNAWYTDASDHNFTLWPYSASRFVTGFLKLRPEELKVDGYQQDPGQNLQP